MRYTFFVGLSLLHFCIFIVKVKLCKLGRIDGRVKYKPIITLNTCRTLLTFYEGPVLGWLVGRYGWWAVGLMWAKTEEPREKSCIQGSDASHVIFWPSRSAMPTSPGHLCWSPILLLRTELNPAWFSRSDEIGLYLRWFGHEHSLNCIK